VAKGLPDETNPEDFTFESQAPPVGFRNVHPGPGGGKKFKGKDTVAWGGSDGLESIFFRCKQCGFVNNRKYNKPGSGWGNETLVQGNTDATLGQYNDSGETYGSTDMTYNGVSNVATGVTDIINGGGCPLCGSSEAE